MTGPLRVTFDREIFWAQRRGGVSRYFVELARQFGARPQLGVDARLPEGLTVNEHLHDFDPVRHPLLRAMPDVFPIRPLANRAMRIAGRRAPTGWAQSDVLHHTHFAPEIVARTPKAIRVITVHDMIPVLMPDLPQARTRSDRLRRALRAADGIICVSHSTKSDLMRLWGDSVRVPVAVVHHGVGEEFHPHGTQMTLGSPYVIYVGTRRDYKDFDTLLRACAVPALRREMVRVLCVGGGPFTGSEASRIADLGLAEVVEQRDLSGSDLPAGYRGALAYVCTSKYEGFGLPVLEALACACPVVVSDTPALQEVGGAAVVSFPPGDADALAETLLQILGMGLREAAERAQRGSDRAGTFTWQATARATAAVYERVVEASEHDR